MVGASLREWYDAGEPLDGGRQSSVRRTDDRVYKEMNGNIIADLFGGYKRLGGEEPRLSAEDRARYEAASDSRLAAVDVPAPYVMDRDGTTLEEEYVPGPTLDTYLDDLDPVDDTGAIRSAGATVGRYMRDMHDAGLARLDTIMENIVVDTGGFADDTLTYIDNEMLVPDATPRDREIEQIIFLSNIRQLDGPTRDILRDGFEEAYGEAIPPRVERRARAHAAVAPVLFAVSDRLTGR